MMDVLAIASYLFFSLRMGHVPFWSDIQHFYSSLGLMEIKGPTRIFLQCIFFISLGLLLTLFISAWCFLRKKKINLLFITLQEVMRIFSLSCSVAIFPLIVRFLQIENALVGFILFAVSETLKIGSLLWIKKHNC